MATPSVDELLEALREALEVDHGPADALTSAQWADLLGIGVVAARDRIRRLLRDRKMERVTVRRVNMKGVEQPVAAYRIVA